MGGRHSRLSRGYQLMIVFDAIFTPEQLLNAYPAFIDEFPQLFNIVKIIQPQNIEHISEEAQQHIAMELIEHCEQYLKGIEATSRTDAKTQLILKLQAQAVDFYYGDKKKNQKKVLSDKIRNKITKTYQDLHKIHSDEHHFKGNINIFYWLANIKQGVVTKDSFHDVLDKKKPVPYFDVETRQEFKVTIKDGAFYHSKNDAMRPIDTNDILDNQREREGYRLYVIDIHGNFYVDNWPDVVPDSFCHSSFLSGDTVQCAGLIKINNGKLAEISIESGHYRPQPDHLLKVLRQLRFRNEVDLSTVDVVFLHEEKNKTPWLYHCNADKYLKQKGMALSRDIKSNKIPDRDSALYMDTAEVSSPLQQHVGDINSRQEMLLDIQEVVTNIIHKYSKALSNEQLTSIQNLSNIFYDTDYNKFSKAQEIQQWALGLVEKNITVPSSGLFSKLFKNPPVTDCKLSLLDRKSVV